MQKKFKSMTSARKFVAATGGKVKKGKACKLADGTKASWYTLTWAKKKAKKRR
jgi:hypothetical protein